MTEVQYWMGKTGAQKQKPVIVHLFVYLSELSAKVVKGMSRALKWRLQRTMIVKVK